jgi:hypothetical protein
LHKLGQPYTCLARAAHAVTLTLRLVVDDAGYFNGMVPGFYPSLGSAILKGSAILAERRVWRRDGRGGLGGRHPEEADRPEVEVVHDAAAHLGSRLCLEPRGYAPRRHLTLSNKHLQIHTMRLRLSGSGTYTIGNTLVDRR